MQFSKICQQNAKQLLSVSQIVDFSHINELIF